MLWSILIPTVPGREEMLSALLSSLERQVGSRPIEILSLYDNKRSTIGEKRNMLLRMARGEYFSFIDDDDTISDQYVFHIMDAMEKHPVDVIHFTEVREGFGVSPLATIHSLQAGDGKMVRENEWGFRWHNEWLGLPNHLSVWRHDAVRGIEFPDVNWQEDLAWSQNASLSAHTEWKIDHVLYTYNYGRID